jgi:hypothetical protein
MRSTLESAFREIFETYGVRIANEPDTYVVPAVWGSGDGSQLDAEQQGIQETARTAADSIIETLTGQGDSSLQEFGMRFLVRELFVWRLAFMRQLALTCLVECGREWSGGGHEGLDSMEIEGNA